MLVRRWPCERLVRHADQPKELVAAADDLFLDVSDACRVVLRLQLRLDGAPLDGAKRPSVGARRDVHGRVLSEYPRLVERAAGRVVLLPVDVAGRGMGFHNDPGLPALDSGLPGVTRPYEPAVPQLERSLAHVPDVPLPVLGVPVERPL